MLYPLSYGGFTLLFTLSNRDSCFSEFHIDAYFDVGEDVKKQMADPSLPDRPTQ